MKIISERDKDRGDVKGIIRMTGVELDREYLDENIKELSERFDVDEILEFYVCCWREVEEDLN